MELLAGKFTCRSFHSHFTVNKHLSQVLGFSSDAGSLKMLTVSDMKALFA